MAYQGPWLPGPPENKDFTDTWNNCRLEDANIVHWHGSRTAAAKLALMQSINDQMGVPAVPVKSRPTKTIDISHLP
jgi:hypothetical protein